MDRLTPVCRHRKCIMGELQVKFYLGQNEDCNLGNSTSDSSERLLHRGGRGGGGQHRCDFVKGEYMQSRLYIYIYIYM